MIYRPSLTVLFILIALLALGCGSTSPVAPDNTENQVPEITGQSNPAQPHQLWGLWQGSYDPETGNFELAQMRSAEFHLNVTGKLQHPFAPGLSISINEFDKIGGYIDLDLTIKHPFPGTDYRGFDVRGILMGAGDRLTGQMDDTVSFADATGFRLLNADGHTRWWNAVEFTSPGMYGFDPGDLGMGFFVPQTTLNPYKYYSDPLEETDPVVPLVNISNRGTFSTDLITSSLTRNYQIQFPMGGGGNPNWLFQYAIDASYMFPTSGNPPPKPISDFPLEANSPEAFNIEVDTEGSTAYYLSDSNRGGNIVLKIEVFDWGAMTNPLGIRGEVESVWIESATLFDNPIGLTNMPYSGSQPTSGIYEITIPNVHPTGLNGQEILITVHSADPTTYAPPAAGPAYPQDALLAAYKLAEIPIIDESPVDDYLQLDDPNGGEIWVIGESETIKWTSVGDVGPDVKIEYNISDGTPVEIISSTENDGSYIWDPIPSVDSDKVRVIITDLTNASIWDDSDDFFTISPDQPDKSLELTSPDGGEELTGGGSWTITWESVGPIVNVKLELSTNNGLSYDEEIVASTEDDEEYFWNPVPSIDNTNCKVKITDVDDDTVNDNSDLRFSISTQAGGSGWNPVPGQIQIPLEDPEPYQLGTETDIAVYSDGGENQSLGEIVDQQDSTFYTYNDAYTATTGTSWTHPISEIGAMHKFDVLPGGDWLFLTYEADDAWGPPSVNDPSYCIMSSHDNSNGMGSYVFFGDGGGPIEDPDEAPWWRIVDFSCGVPGGVNDSWAYQVMVQTADSPVPHSGSVGLIWWGSPYNTSNLGGLFIGASTQGGGSGRIDDTDPGSMAVAVDDNSGLTIDGTHPAPAYWILDSTGEAQSILAGWEATSVLYIDNRLDNEEFGSDTPVDLEIANAKDFGYSVSESADFNWICVLFDTSGTNWRVGVWECDYLANDGSHAELHEIDITEPIAGTPMAIDVDPVDFEIHVLSEISGQIVATVFDYTP